MHDEFAPRRPFECVSAHAAPGAPLPSLATTSYWHDRWAESEREKAQLATRLLQIELDCAALRVLVNRLDRR